MTPFALVVPVHDFVEGRSCGRSYSQIPTVRCYLFEEEHGVQHQGWVELYESMLTWSDVERVSVVELEELMMEKPVRPEGDDARAGHPIPGLYSRKPFLPPFFKKRIR